LCVTLSGRTENVSSSMLRDRSGEYSDTNSHIKWVNEPVRDKTLMEKFPPGALCVRDYISSSIGSSCRKCSYGGKRKSLVCQFSGAVGGVQMHPPAQVSSKGAVSSQSVWSFFAGVCIAAHCRTWVGALTCSLLHRTNFLLFGNLHANVFQDRLVFVFLCFVVVSPSA
jgi:hypothetical protein